MEHALTKRTLHRWVTFFSTDRDPTKGEHSTGRPISVTDKNCVVKEKELTDSNRRYTIKEIAQELDISERSVFIILRTRLGMR